MAAGMAFLAARGLDLDGLGMGTTAKPSPQIEAHLHEEQKQEHLQAEYISHPRFEHGRKVQNLKQTYKKAKDIIA